MKQLLIGVWAICMVAAVGCATMPDPVSTTYLSEIKSDESERFSAVGFGEFSPLVPNTSVQNKAQNRRVDISLVPIPKS